MFDNEHYLTCGIEAAIPPITQLLLWQMIDLLPTEPDYLQVFELSDHEGVQKILHKQERPEYEAEAVLIGPEPVSAKIFVIDDGDHSTMLLADEY